MAFLAGLRGLDKVPPTRMLSQVLPGDKRTITDPVVALKTRFSFADITGQNVRRGFRQLKGGSRWSMAAGNSEEAPNSQPHQKRAKLFDAAPAGVAADAGAEYS